ncbi:hypothetical protein M378DRAFT_160284 [Amanita muscaria Koide BX008]|uniref:Uncharacterized protein n=1 Tax=Amanita muscaria (strain Koide BX008) TaxID=946122 RepID=A0A0C2TIH7_AMAMK|nr:hypothetical protein M378DRAFT_160284 [Amanita muscaria Koide BX008]
MRDLLLHLAIMEGICRPVTSSFQTERLCLNDSDVIRTEISTEERQQVHEDDLVGCIYSLLTQLRKAKLEPSVNTTIIELMRSLLRFDYAEIAKRVCSVADAQILMDFIDSLTNDSYFLTQCVPDTARQATCLALEIHARVPVLPRSLFLNSDVCPGHDWYHRRFLTSISILCQGALLGRISDHNYIVPLSRIYERDGHEGDTDMYFVSSSASESKSLQEWREKSEPGSVEIIKAVSLTTSEQFVCKLFTDVRSGEGYSVSSLVWCCGFV